MFLPRGCSISFKLGFGRVHRIVSALYYTSNRIEYAIYKLKKDYGSAKDTRESTENKPSELSEAISRGVLSATLSGH